MTNQCQNTGYGTVFKEAIGRGSRSPHPKTTHEESVVVSLNHGLLPPLTVISSRFKIDSYEAYTTNRDTVILTVNNLTQTDLPFIGRPKSG